MFILLVIIARLEFYSFKVIALKITTICSLFIHFSTDLSMLCILQVPWFVFHCAMSSQLSQPALVVEKVHPVLRK